MKTIMDKEKNIDKLFKERLGEDNPAFKEQYWQGFEKMLKATPPAGGASSAGGFTKILSTLTFTKGIIAVVSVALVSSLIYYASRPVSTVKPIHEPAGSIANSSSPAEPKAADDYPSARQEPGVTMTAPAQGIQPSFTPSSPSASHAATSDSKILAGNTETITIPTVAAKSELSVVGPVTEVSALPQKDETSSATAPISDSTAKLTVVKADSLNYDSLVAAIEAAAREKSSAASDKLKDSRLKFYAVPGIGIFKTLGNSQGFTSVGQTSFQFGAGVSYKLSDQFSLYLEANAQRLSGFELDKSSVRTEYLFYQWFNAVTVENREFLMLNVPFMLRWQYKQHSLAAGPSLRYLLSSSGEKVVRDSSMITTSYDNSKATNYLQGFNRLQPAIAMEYAWNFYRQHAVLVRYSYVFGDFVKAGYYDNLHNGSVNMISFGFRFRIY